jgi:heme-degrading monooxygenase HmoA
MPATELVNVIANGAQRSAAIRFFDTDRHGLRPRDDVILVTFFRFMKGEKTMFANMTHLKVAPENGDKFIQALAGEHLRPLLMEAPGFRYNFFLADSAAPGEYYSITFWDAPDQAKAFFGGPGYAEITAEVVDLLLETPTRWGLKVEGALDLTGMLTAA